MASPTEQSEALLQQTTDKSNTDSSENINSSVIEQNPPAELSSVSQHDSNVVQGSKFTDGGSESFSPKEMTSEFLHHAVKEGAPSVGSAFHVVCHLDGHKELTSGISENEVSKDEPPISTHRMDIEERESHAKHFSAHVVEQDGVRNIDVPENESESKKRRLDAAELREENNLLDIDKGNSEIGCVGEIDDAAEKALLADNDEPGQPVRHVHQDTEGSQTSADGKDNPEIKFLKPSNFSVLGTNMKNTPMVNTSVDNDVERELVNQKNVHTHVPEKVFNIDEETRMGLDQTPVDNNVIEAPFTHPSLPPKKLFQTDDTKDSDISDIDTKMSATADTEDMRLINTLSVDDATKDSAASDSNMETPPSKKARRASREGLGISMIESLEAGQRIFSAENLFEYQWPLDGGEWHMLQEQVSEYLKIKSFKRKYPDLYRRTCDKEEKDFLREKGVVTETQSDLGLTALRSEEVYDLMMKDYNEKYKEYIAQLQEKQKKVIRDKHKEYSAAKLDKSKIEAYSKKAARSAAEFNATLMRDKKEERRAYFDLQTYTIHFPKHKFKTLPAKYTKVGAYPVALIAGQYQDNYKKYSSEEIKYLPVKTALLDPPKLMKYVCAPPSGVKLVSAEQKLVSGSDGEESDSSGEEDDSPDIDNLGENDSVDNKTGVPDDGEVTIVKVEKRTKSSSKKKAAKLGVTPEKVKKYVKKNKELDADKMDDKTSQDDDENGGSKMPGKIHGLEKCRICKKRSTKDERKSGKLVKCAECGKIGHMSCLDLTEELVAVIKTYPWQCMECKTCIECLDPYDEDKMMFCDRCDRGYHTFCIGLSALPTGHWECKSCEGCPKILPQTQPRKNVKVIIPDIKPETNIKEEEISINMIDDKSTCAVLGDTLDESDVGVGQILGLGQVMEVVPVVGVGQAVGMGQVLEVGQVLGVAPVLGAGPVMEETAVVEVVSGGTDTPVRIEKRGRKRKASDALPEPKPKQERIQGARQSRRLKLKEEEEEEKKKKEQEEKAQKKKNKKKVKSGKSVEDSKEIVDERVDDSRVNVFDKNDGEERMTCDQTSEGMRVGGMQPTPSPVLTSGITGATGTLGGDTLAPITGPSPANSSGSSALVRQVESSSVPLNSSTIISTEHVDAYQTEEVPVVSSPIPSSVPPGHTPLSQQIHSQPESHTGSDLGTTKQQELQISTPLPAQPPATVDLAQEQSCSHSPPSVACGQELNPPAEVGDSQQLPPQDTPAQQCRSSPHQDTTDEIMSSSNLGQSLTDRSSLPHRDGTLSPQDSPAAATIHQRVSGDLNIGPTHLENSSGHGDV